MDLGNTYSIDSSCVQQLRRPFGDKRTVHYGNKDTSPKKPTVRHLHVDFVEGWSICLVQTFKSISCSETSVANRVSIGHKDIKKMYPAWSTSSRFASALSQWGVSKISDQKYDLRNSVTEIILRGEEGGTRYSCTEERRLCISIECSTLWLKLDKRIQSQ